MKYAIVLKDETPRLESTQAVTGEKHITNMDSIVADDTTKPEPERCLALDIHKGTRKVLCCATHSIGTRNVINMNQGKLNIVKQEMELLNILGLDVSKLKWTGTGLF